MKLFYREKGDSTLPPLIILHGLWGASDNWLKVAGLLAEKFHVILPDLRNHGNSPHAPENSYEVLAEDIQEMIIDLDLQQKPFLAGHSMGGKTLMALLLKKPEIAAKAAIIDISPQTYPVPTEHQTILDFILTTTLSAFQNRHELQQYIYQAFLKEEMIQILLKNIRKTPGRFEWKVNAIAIQNNLQQLCSWPHSTLRYSYPLLFIRGEHSDYISSINPIRIHFPAAQLKTIPNASHRIHAEQPEQLAITLSEFFLSTPKAL